VDTGSSTVGIFEKAINGMKIRYASTGLIISPANPPEWVKNYVNKVTRLDEYNREYAPQDPQSPVLYYDDSEQSFEWHGEFRRTRHEQMNIESYNEKDLV
jgi:hypothetical protein